jgi:hypothetical protein
MREVNSPSSAPPVPSRALWQSIHPRKDALGSAAPLSLRGLRLPGETLPVGDCPRFRKRAFRSLIGASFGRPRESASHGVRSEASGVRASRQHKPKSAQLISDVWHGGPADRGNRNSVNRKGLFQN